MSETRQEIILPYRFYMPHERVGLDTGTESHVKQSFKDETNINNIMRKYRATGLLDHVNNHQGNYGDFTGLPDGYHEAQDMVLAAQAMFETIPADIRVRFNNDPGQFLAFAEDSQNEDAMRELGLLPSKMAAEQPPARTPEGDGTALAADITGRPVTTPESGSEAAPATPGA